MAKIIHMHTPKPEHWIELCRLALEQNDREEFIKLLIEINRVLGERERVRKVAKRLNWKDLPA